MNDSPVKPVVAISAAIVVENRVLLIQRARAPGQGVWTLPGGVVEPGETMASALKREIREELALDIELIGLVDARDVISRNAAGKLEHHYVVLAFAAELVGGRMEYSDEIANTRWAGPSDLTGLETSDGLRGILAGAITLSA